MLFPAGITLIAEFLVRKLLSICCDQVDDNFSLSNCWLQIVATFPDVDNLLPHLPPLFWKTEGNFQSTNRMSTFASNFFRKLASSCHHLMEMLIFPADLATSCSIRLRVATLPSAFGDQDRVASTNITCWRTLQDFLVCW